VKWKGPGKSSWVPQKDLRATDLLEAWEQQKLLRQTEEIMNEDLVESTQANVHKEEDEAIGGEEENGAPEKQQEEEESSDENSGEQKILKEEVKDLQQGVERVFYTAKATAREEREKKTRALKIQKVGQWPDLLYLFAFSNVRLFHSAGIDSRVGWRPQAAWKDR